MENQDLLYEKLCEAEQQSRLTTTRHTHDEVMEAARKVLDKQ